MKVQSQIIVSLFQILINPNLSTRMVRKVRKEEGRKAPAGAGLERGTRILLDLVPLWLQKEIKPPAACPGSCSDN